MATMTERRMPIGAEVRPDGGVHFRVWAPERRRVEVVFEGGERGRGARARGGRLPRRHGRRGRPRHAVPLPARRRGALPRPRLAVPAGRAARAVGGDRPGRLRLVGRRRARDRPRPARSSTRSTSAPSPRGDLGGRRPRAAGPGRAGHHDRRADARGRLPRPLRLGLRRRRLLRADPPLRPPRRLPPLRRPRPRRGPRGDPRRRLQPLRPRRQLPDQVQPPLRLGAAQDRLGRRAELRRRALRPGPRVRAGERRPTGSTSSASTASGSTPRSRSTTTRPITC